MCVCVFVCLIVCVFICLCVSDRPFFCRMHSDISDCALMRAIAVCVRKEEPDWSGPPWQMKLDGLQAL